MRYVAMREFRRRGVKALADVPPGETTLLVDKKGQAYFVVPVCGDIAKQEQDLRRVIARASLRESWRLAEKFGPIGDEEIDAEISAVRSAMAMPSPN